MNLKINSRGVFFSAIALLLLLVLFGLIIVLNNSLNQSGKNFNDLFALKTVSNKFDSVSSNISELNKAQKLMPLNSRYLPFDYNIDQNMLYLSYQFPISSTEMDLFYDVVNAYSVFASDLNVKNAYDGTSSQVGAPKNRNWGGKNNSLYFNLLPQCMQLLVVDGNKIRLNNYNQVGCEKAFDSSEMQRIDLNVGIQYKTDDFNQITCNFDGNSTCPVWQDFNSAIQLPYFQFKILDANCGHCVIPAALKTIKGHYNPAKVNTITMSCVGASCVDTNSYQLTIGSGFQMDFIGNSLQLSQQMQFKQKVNSFYFQDLNIVVQRTDYGAVKSRTK